MFITETVNYLEDTEHWATSSYQKSTCSFEPGTVEDVGIAVCVLYHTHVFLFTKMRWI